MTTHRVSLWLPCVLSLALFTGGIARAEEGAAAPRLGIRAKIGGALGGVIKAVGDGVTRVTGRLEFRKWVKQDEDVRGRYYVEKEKQGVGAHDVRALLHGTVTGVATYVAVTSANPLIAIPAVAYGASTAACIKGSLDARRQARINTVSHMLNVPGTKIPTAVLKLHKLDLEHAIGQNERSVTKGQQDIAKSQAAIKQATDAIVRERAELDKVNHSLPTANTAAAAGLPAAMP